MFLRLLTYCVLVLASPVWAQDSFWTQAMGVAPLSKSQPVTAARRQALAEALVVAAMAGGADIRGHTVMDKARIQADRMVMRPSGRIHKYQVIEDRQNGSYWQITLKALVGPDDQGSCQDQQRFVVNAYPPKVRVHPNAPAWAVPLGHEMANMALDSLEAHPNFDLAQMLTDSDKKNMSAKRMSFDYAALTRGTRSVSKTDHNLSMDIALESRPNGQGGFDLWATLDIGLYSPTRPAVHKTVTTKFAYKHFSAIDRVTGAKRSKAHDALYRTTQASVQEALKAFSCQAPVATLHKADGGYHVDLGSRHGLTQGALGFILNFNKTLQPFEVVRLNSESAIVKPIGGITSANGYDGAEVIFLKARMP